MTPREKHIADLKAFQKHMIDTFNAACEDSAPTALADFFSLDFTISFNGKTVNVANYADTFQIIEDLLQTEISDLEED